MFYNANALVEYFKVWMCVSLVVYACVVHIKNDIFLFQNSVLGVEEVNIWKLLQQASQLKHHITQP